MFRSVCLFLLIVFAFAAPVFARDAKQGAAPKCYDEGNGISTPNFTVYFKTGKHTIEGNDVERDWDSDCKEQFEERLKSKMTELAASGKFVAWVIGLTDNQGTWESNLELGDRRGQYVINLIKNAGSELDKGAWELPDESVINSPIVVGESQANIDFSNVVYNYDSRPDFTKRAVWVWFVRPAVETSEETPPSSQDPIPEPVVQYINKYIKEYVPIVINTETSITRTVVGADYQMKMSVSDIVRRLDATRARLSDASVWTDKYGNFNTSRLVSDGVAAIVLGTVGGVVTSKLVKKSQVKSGFENINCTVGGQFVSKFGDWFSVGKK